MDNQQWDKINAILNTALDLDETERAAYIKKECNNNDLHAQVNELLQYIETAESENFLKSEHDFPNNLIAEFTGIETLDTPSSLIGKTIDRYKITKLIGHGGMGSVFKAERTDDLYQGEVALKIIRRGMDTPSNINRFKRERKILAKLNHPNIARLLDGGVTEEKLPYLVMEYIDGIPLDEYCNRHQLSTENRIALLNSVCEAVNHAHKNAVIHRDLKPSNILVNEKGHVKVLDFGIAKLMEPDNLEKTFFQTHTGSRMLTLAYSSPEQVEGGPVTTTTDTYTLGILFYEVLAGVRPFDLKNKNLSTIEQHIRQWILPKPSVRYNGLSTQQQRDIARNQNAKPKTLCQRLKGDLDAIIMKAIRKEPNARYSSVVQILDDLNRYHQSLPLIAKDDTIRYRTSKFIKRNGKVVASVLFILIATLGFGSFHIQQVNDQRDMAQQEARKAETVKNFLVDIFRSSNPQTTDFEGKDMSAKKLLINSQNTINEDLQDQPDVYAEVLLTIGEALENTEAFDEAENSYQMVLAQAPKTNHPLANKARAYVKLADLMTTRTKPEQALLYIKKAQQTLKEMNTLAPNLQASVLACLGKINTMMENYQKSKKFYQQADSIYLNSELDFSLDYLDMLTWYGRSLIYNSNYRKAVETLKRSNRIHQNKYTNPTLIVAENYHMLGWAYRELSIFENSNSFFKKAIELKSKLAGSEQFTTARSIYFLSLNYTFLSEFEKSEKYAREALNIFEKQADSTNAFIRQSKIYIAIALYNQNKFSEAKKYLQEAIQHAIQENGRDHISVAAPSAQMAIVYMKTKEFEKAASILEETVKINKRVYGKNSRGFAEDLNLLATAYREMGKYELARKYYKQAKPIFEKIFAKNHRSKAKFFFEYGKFFLKTDHPQQAQKYFNKAYTFYHNSFGADNKLTTEVKFYLNNTL